MAFVLRDSFSGGTETNSWLTATKWWAQTFTPSVGYTITRVDLKLYRISTAWTLTVSIKATSNGKPTGDDLASATYNTAGVTLNSGGNWYTVAFETGVALTQGVTYAIIVRASGGVSGVDCISWKGTNYGDYGGGDGGASTNSGSTWTMYGTVDIAFKTYSGGDYTYLSPIVYGVGTSSFLILAGHSGDPRESGDRPALALYPETMVPEHLQFLTTINRMIDGTEERITGRKVPQKVIEMQIADNRQYMESILYGRTGDRVTIPHWYEPAYLSVAALVGDNHIHVVTTALSEFTAGGYVLVYRNFGCYDALEVDTVTETEITFKSSELLLNDYPTKTQVLPLSSAYVEGGITISRRMDYAIYDAKFAIEPQDNDLGLTAYVNGELTISDVNAVDGDLTEGISQLLHTVDNPQGLFSKSTLRTTSDRGCVLGFKTHDRAELWDLREMLYKLQGMKVSFYLMTFAKDLVPVALLPSAQTTLDVAYCGYTAHVGAQKDIRVCLRNGTFVSKTVVSWQVISSLVERLTVDSVWGNDIQVADIDRIEYRDLVRLDTDDVVIQHTNALGYAVCQVPVVRCNP